MQMSNARPMQRHACTTILALGLFAGCGLAAATTTYDIKRFQDPRGQSTSFFPTGINNNHVIAGTASPDRGFTLSGASITLFDVPSAFNNFTFGDDINNSGIVVGTYRNSSGGHGFILDNGSYTTINVPGATNETLVTGINDAGQLVGQYRRANTTNYLGFVKSGATFTLLDAAQAQPNTAANGINNAGQVVGFVGGGGTASRGFTFENGTYGFFDAPGAVWTQGFGINNQGQIVGVASTGLFVKDGANFTTLALPANWNARSPVATDVSDDGVVVGYFTDNGTNLMYGFMATPTAAVPEPASLAMLLAGGLALHFGRRARRRC
ncbi:putative PEP-CTERM sorting domain-containing protein [Rubrivivax sp. A210]|uniref:PEP-CTERM sorting domain-containing protein n=1 Tax=Rubrivivax sp. A210 TaxID=2772301 RepID=UPI00191886C3|nr:PEP-CTERM sorting domain-containing protein [Rubrivivax sp. A210]CAD5375059.1 putative PEP-CTERM sorting domain-containing protein [Rubrivivax sp. A210]